jgi:hypothetical protein
MTDQLIELFNLPERDKKQSVRQQVDESKSLLTDIDTAIDKIDQALPVVTGLDHSDQELDELADIAKDKFQDLMDLGFNVDSRFAGEIFSVASNMLGHAINAKTAKFNKKLRMVELQLKKSRLDQQAPDSQDNLPVGQGHILSRNELLERLLADRKQNSKKE